MRLSGGDQALAGFPERGGEISPRDYFYPLDEPIVLPEQSQRSHLVPKFHADGLTGYGGIAVSVAALDLGACELLDCGCGKSSPMITTELAHLIHTGIGHAVDKGRRPDDVQNLADGVSAWQVGMLGVLSTNRSHVPHRYLPPTQGARRRGRDLSAQQSNENRK